MDDLTPRQKEILTLIKKYVKEKNYPPSVREIGLQVGLSSSSTVHSHLESLEKKGYIKRDPTKPRAIEILDDFIYGGNNDIPGTRRIPVVGQVAAGMPIFAEENIEDYFPVPENMVKEDKVFMLRVKGESMRDAGILNGDYVIVRQQNEAQTNEIVVALVEGEATVKRLLKNNGQVILKPENELYEPITGTDIAVIGKVIGLFRKL